MAGGLRALFKAFGADLPSTGTVLETRTIVVSLLVGTVVTLLSTIAPAIRATRVAPLAALREGFSSEHKRSRWATPLASVLTVGGLGVMAIGLFASLKPNAALSLMGLGAVLTFLGVAFLQPRLVGPIAGFVGAPFERLRGITGRIARENTVRQPGRTAVTAAALMIGVALVTFASVFAGSAKTTFRDAVTNGSKAQAVIQNTDGFGSFTTQATKAVQRDPGRARRRRGPLRPGQGRRQEAGRHRHRPGDVRLAVPQRLEAGRRGDVAAARARARSSSARSTPRTTTSRWARRCSSRRACASACR